MSAVRKKHARQLASVRTLKSRHMHAVPKETNSSGDVSIRSLIVALLLIVGIVASINWDDIVSKNPDGSYSLEPERLAEIERQKDQLGNCHQYWLYATTSSYHVCYMCPTGMVWLNAGEIWKIGETCQCNDDNSSSTRYRKTELAGKLAGQPLNYIIGVRGNKAQVRAAEVSLIGGYPLLPENVARLGRDNEYPLAFPPGSQKPQLRGI